MANEHAPYHPIIYVRGFAGTQGEIDDTVGDPYMGFNVGSTKSRQVWDGKMRRYYFESPLVRLKDEAIWKAGTGDPVLSDARYDDVYVDGEDLTAPHPDDATKPLRSDVTLPYQSIVILRYYDDASTDFGDAKAKPLEQFAKGLSELILRLRTLVCRKGGKHPIRPGETLDNGVAEGEFKVHLVAHSMGGLVCRAFLQNKDLGSADARAAVDKLFTYATPHNGIDLRIVRNVPGWSALGEATNFNRDRMAEYLGFKKKKTDEVSELLNFPAERVFNLVGTNPADYLVAKGLSSWAVGDSSDGLVRMDNATTFENRQGERIESPRAYAHRSHSGQYGIVNSEEGFQNLTRFLFGSVRADGWFDVDDVTLPDEVQNDYDAGKEVRASYRFEIVAALRASQWQLHRRVVRENSAIQLAYDDLFPAKAKGKDKGTRKASTANSPHLFSLFLDPTKSQRRHESVAFAFDVTVLVPDYQVDGVLWLKKHFEGSSLVRRQIIVEATRKDTAIGGWELTYGDQNETPVVANTRLEDGVLKFEIPIEPDADKPVVNPWLKGRLRIEVRNWA